MRLSTHLTDTGKLAFIGRHVNTVGDIDTGISAPSRIGIEPATTPSSTLDGS